ncbi:hypothetical protein GSI_10447 [Ganoderma sinense ZZ0214-1]|uniref:DUF7137 domain-containing protein n=1 Tax=Ganoderma sinense ZZ0214-1 TaxID=1077348 RepID=A0A2G8S0K1_9APHY|nr:hypothetical protein GSI_10447 [Ganoderma sinense ZZ0214-1]
MSQSTSASASGQQSTSGSGSSSSSAIPQTAPAGGLTITKPPQTATSFFKIAPSNTITFAWNFTDVLSTPTHLTVSAIGENGNTYPVGPTDGIIDGTATSVTWDLWSYQQAHSTLPLAPGSYVLHIWDDRGPGAAREPGLLQENSALKFALYTPQSYTPLESWVCSTCSGAWTDFATHPAFVSLTVTFVVMFLSGYSLIRQALR